LSKVQKTCPAQYASNFALFNCDVARENPLLDAQRWQVIFNLAESSKPGSRQRQQLCFDRPPGKLPSRPSAPRAGPQPRGSTVPSVPSGTALVSEIGNLTMAPSCGEVEGAVQIRHPNRCQIAAAAYGKKYIGIMKSFLEPHGCLHRKFDQDMMFNRLQTNVTKKAVGVATKMSCGFLRRGKIREWGWSSIHQ